MRVNNWNDLRYLPVVRDRGSLAATARHFGVDDTTVSRRLAALQALAAQPLYTRVGDGTLALTALGNRLAEQADAMQRHAAIAEQLLGDDDGAGVVCVTSVPVVVNHLLAPAAARLLAAHPQLQLQLQPDGRDFDLRRREADLAVRLARPLTGGSQVTARRLAELSCSVYCAAGTAAAERDRLPWIGYGRDVQHRPQARWIADTARQRGEPVAGLRVHDLETALQATLSGAGKTPLPDRIAARFADLLRLPEQPPPPARELWLLGQAEQRQLRKIKTVSKWIEQTLK